MAEKTLKDLGNGFIEVVTSVKDGEKTVPLKYQVPKGYKELFAWAVSLPATNEAAGKVYAAVIKNGIDGTTVFDLDPSVAVEPYATFVEQSSNLATVTINRSATGRKTAVVDRPLFLLGTDDYFEVPDHANLDFAAGDSFTIAIALRQYGQITVSPSRNCFWKRPPQNGHASMKRPRPATSEMTNSSVERSMKPWTSPRSTA